MYGRGRGSYLGLLLESHIGKSAVPIEDRTPENVAKEENSSPSTTTTRENKPSTITTSHIQDEKRSPQSTWTSLDLLGNKGRRSRSGSDPSSKPNQENPHLDDQTRTSVKDNLVIFPDQKPNTEPVKKFHLISPEEFLHSPPSKSKLKEEPQQEISELDTSSENSESHSSSGSRYIPPHLRKGFSGKPDICPDPAIITKYKKLEAPSTYASTGTTELYSPQTMVESELNWHKWKLQRSFKKLLNALSAENVVGLSVEIRKICEASQLSTRFPGTSEVNVFADLLVARAIEQKDSLEVVVQMCRLLNAMYKDEFSANLKDVLRQYRQETFGGVVNKNSRCENFCIFLGKLCDVAKDETKSFQDCLRQSVMACLHEWISSFKNNDEYTQEAEIKVSYLCFLLDVTKNVLTTEKGSWIKSCFGKVKNCILSENVTRSVRENLLDQVIKCSLQSPTAKDSDILRASAESSRSVSENRSPGDNFVPGNISEEKHETKPGRDVDCQTRLKNLENNLKEILSEIESVKRTENQNEIETQKQIEMQNETETQSKDEKLKESNANTDVDKLTNYQSSVIRPPPGFSYPGAETRGLPSSEEEQVKNNELSVAIHLPQTTTTREVSLAGEKKNNIMEFKDENTQAGNPFVNWTENSDKKNFNERLFPKYKGRGRGRRDNTGTLENSKDNNEYPGLSGDARGSRWNSRDANRSQHMAVRDNTSGYVEWSRNDSGYNRPQSGWTDLKKNYDKPSGYSNNFNTDATEPRAQFGSSSSADVRARTEFGSSVPVGCFICGGKDHRSAYCKNNAAMFD